MKKIFLLFILSGAACIAFSQKVDIGFFAGTANYEGDLQDKFFTFSQPRVALGGLFTVKVSDRISLRAGITFASVSADDKKNSKVFFRNLNFVSPITEFHAGVEYHLFNMDDIRFSPYFFIGIAAYHFNPYTTDTLGVKYYLKPLGTEGEGYYQNMPQYNLMQIAIPFGGGIKYEISPRISIGVEAGLRKLFTDYLDDVSNNYIPADVLLANRGSKALELAYRGGELKTGATYPTGILKRGEPKNKDWYYFTTFSISLKLPGRGEIDDRWGRSDQAKKFKGSRCPRKIR